MIITVENALSLRQTKGIEFTINKRPEKYLIVKHINSESRFNNNIILDLIITYKIIRSFLLMIENFIILYYI